LKKPPTLRRTLVVVRWVSWLVGVFAASGGEPPPRLLLLDGARVGGDYIAVGERGTILRSSTNGQSWRELPRVTQATLTAVSFAEGGAADATPHQGWAVGHDALILATNDRGQTWTQQFQGKNLEDSFLCVLALGPQHAIAAGAYGLFAETTDGGVTWSQRTIVEGDAHFYALVRAPAGQLYLCGERGTLLRSADQGRTWKPIGPASTSTLFGVLPLADDTLLAHGLSSRIFRTSDDGASWQEITTPQPVLLASALKLSGGAIMLAGYAGTLLISEDNGRSFRTVPSPTKAIAKLIELPSGDVLALGEAGVAVVPSPRGTR
jgi:photosystem II stability/assembly factor-like uncharacterized protein